MPTVLKERGYRFYFYSNERDEPAHIHIEHSDKDAKFWLDTMKFAYVYGFTTKQQREIAGIIAAHTNILRKAWDDFHSRRG